MKYIYAEYNVILEPMTSIDMWFCYYSTVY